MRHVFQMTLPTVPPTVVKAVEFDTYSGLQLGVYFMPDSVDPVPFVRVPASDMVFTAIHGRYQPCTWHDVPDYVWRTSDGVSTFEVPGSELITWKGIENVRITAN